MKNRLFLMVALVLLVALTLSTVSAQGVSRSYLILGNGNRIPPGLAAKVQAAGGTLIKTMNEVGIAVAVSSSADFARRIQGVQSVVPNIRFDTIDPYAAYRLAENIEFSNPPTSGDDDTRFDLQWGHDAVNAPEAWNAGARGEGARVAVLDTGFDTDHVDLAPNINYALSANFVPGETLTYALPDPFSHGTHTAGTVAAADNGIGTIGIAPEAELVLVKVLADSGSGDFDWVISGIIHAANVDADVINMSLGAALEKSGYLDDNGTPTNPADDVFVTAREVAELKNAISRATTYAFQMGTTVIASAGNEATDGDHTADLIHLPSDATHVISISATAPIGWAINPSVSLDNPATYTNFGQSVIDFAAPGGDVDVGVFNSGQNCTVGGLLRPCYVFDMVFSTGSNLNPALASYYWSAGTSMAAPHAAGVAAIIIGQNGGSMNPSQVEARLRSYADDLGKPGNDDFYGAGRVSTGY